MSKRNKSQVVDTPEVENADKPLNIEPIYAEEQTDGISGVVTATTVKKNRNADEVTDLDDNTVTDITFTEAEITKDTVFKVLRSFTANIGENGTTTAETGQKVKLSRMKESVIRALIAQGYIEIVG